jgi:transposase-like protein
VQLTMAPGASVAEVARAHGVNAILLKLIQIGVGRGIAQDTAHRDDLAVVMESVSQDVMEDECGRPDRDVSI